MYKCRFQFFFRREVLLPVVLFGYDQEWEAITEKTDREARQRQASRTKRVTQR